VTEPYHLKKNVEFVEPIITTQTIYKEVRPEVIVNESVTKSVGPATYIGEVREFNTKFSQLTLTEKEKTKYLAMSEQERLKLSEEEQWKCSEARRMNVSNYSNQIVTEKIIESNAEVQKQSQKKKGHHDNKF